MTRKPRKNIQYKLAKEYRKSLNNQTFQPMQLIDEFNNYQQIVTECNIKKAVAPHRVQGGMNLPWKLEQYDVSI